MDCQRTYRCTFALALACDVDFEIVRWGLVVWWEGAEGGVREGRREGRKEGRKEGRREGRKESSEKCQIR